MKSLRPSSGSATEHLGLAGTGVGAASVEQVGQSANLQGSEQLFGVINRV